MLRFCAYLRGEYGLGVGHAEAHDALRAVESVGICDSTRFRCALRLVCCSKRGDIEPFERAFDAFFLAPPRGLPQSEYAPKHSRPQGEAEEDDATEARRPRIDAGAADDATTWETLLAKYSAAAGSAPPPSIPDEGLPAMLSAASRLIAAVRLGRSRRWRPLARGQRFDLRRTLRASLHTGGDPVVLRRLGHPLRNPRFVVLIDGSRSMTEHGGLMLQFAYALCRRTTRASAFVFSTDLRQITRTLRSSARAGVWPLDELGEAWGGGTRIGASLLQFARRFPARMSPDDTATIVISDGLDTGEAGSLERAMREIARRSAVVVWVNPHASREGFRPESRGMRAALPYVDVLSGADSARAFGELLAPREAEPG